MARADRVVPRSSGEGKTSQNGSLLDYGWDAYDKDIDDLLASVSEGRDHPPLPSNPPLPSIRPASRSEIVSARTPKSISTPPPPSPEKERKPYRDDDDAMDIGTDEAFQWAIGMSDAVVDTDDGGILRHRQAIALDEAERNLKRMDTDTRDLEEALRTFDKEGKLSALKHFERKALETESRRALEAANRKDEEDVLQQVLALSRLEQLPSDFNALGVEIEKKSEADRLFNDKIDALCEQLLIQLSHIQVSGGLGNDEISTAYATNLQLLYQLSNGEHPLLQELLTLF